MRGRRRGSLHSSSSVSQEQNRMALRKQINKDAGDIPSVSQQIEEDTQDDEAPDDKDELSISMLSTSSAREKRKRERENKSKTKEMTEEEMMDLALRLSEQEASITAIRLRQEEEAVMKAIQESVSAEMVLPSGRKTMVSQTQPCPPSQSQSLLGEADASISISSRRKLLYPNRKKVFGGSQVVSEDDCTPEAEQSRGPKGREYKHKNMNVKQKRMDGSPLMEMPDSNIWSQASPSSSSESLLVPLDSPQSSDSTQIDDCQLRKSPVFPTTACRATVRVPRLSENLLETCTASGFVLCSQDSWTQKSHPAQPQSPTFPKSPVRFNNLISSDTTALLKHGDQGDSAETQLSPQYRKSPISGRNAQNEDPPCAFRAEIRGCENSGFVSLSQESLTSTSHHPRSPVFDEDAASRKSPVFSEMDRGQNREQSQGCSKSPVFGRNTAPLAAELRDPNSEGKPPPCSPQGSERLRQDIDPSDNGRCNDITVLSQPDDAEELTETSEAWNSAERELTSDMTLHWSDEDDDPVASISPVFPEERPVNQADGHTESQKPTTAASPQTNCSLKCHSASFTENQSSSSRHTSPGPSSSSSASTCQQQHLCTTQPAPVCGRRSVSRESAPTGEPLTGQTVHYYWGVPFCPQGLDPDSYTKVILAQMEVYEKSLKQAQKCLLRKAEWGEAILPRPEKSPSPESAAESPQLHLLRRRALRRRGNKPCGAADSPPAEAEEEEDDKKDEEREEDQQEEEKNDGRTGKEQQVDSDDCTVCPETQLSDNDSTQDLMMNTDAVAELRVKSPEQPEVQMIHRDGGTCMDKQQQQQEDEEEMDVDVELEDPEDRETDRNRPVCDAAGGQTERPENRTDPDVEEIQDRGLQRSMSPELEPAAVSQSTKASVDCPICQRSFPVTEIEMHAAYCDGEVAVVDEVSLKPRRKRTRRAEVEVEAEDVNHASITGKSVQSQEKCYICQKTVPLRDYSRHTELCIHRRVSKTAATGSLLSALERTESRDSEAGPSGSKVQPEEVIDLRNEEDDEEEDDDISTIRISNSPIRSFTSISEASDCLIDFRKQHRAKKPSQRRR